MTKIIKDNNGIDAKENRYVMHILVITMAALVLAWIFNQLNIFIVDKKTMNIGVATAFVVFGVGIGICRLFRKREEAIKYILLLVMICVITVIEIMLTYHAVILSVIPIVCSAMYHDTKRMTIYTYFLTILSIIAIVFGGYYMGLCDANMALLTSEPLSRYIGGDGRFILNEVNSNPMLTLSLYFVFPRSVMCGVFVPICNNISKIVAESRINEEKMRALAEIDGMTGLFNRSKYLEFVSDAFITEEKVAVIYWDMNGLKHVNDTMGHEYGDRMILEISNCIKGITSPTDKAYRIGGDEFIMILRGGDERYVRSKIQAVQEMIEEKNKNLDVPLSAAVGYACGTRKELEALIHEADQAMYESKRHHYKEHPQSRRD